MTVEKVTIIAATKLATDPRTIQEFSVGDEIEVNGETQEVVKRLLELRVAIPASTAKAKDGKVAPEKNAAVLGTKEPVKISDDGPADDADADEGEEVEEEDEESETEAPKKAVKNTGNKKAGKK